MTTPYNHVPGRRALIDRRQVAAAVEVAIGGTPPEERRLAVAMILKKALDTGRAEMQRRIAAHPSRGLELAASQSFLIEQLLRLACEATTLHLYPSDLPTTGERIAVAAVGGFGRMEMAPWSDVDIMFLSPIRETPWVEQVVETILYILWDMGLKVGHSTRTPDDMIRMARDDLSVKTSLLEARYIWGDRSLHDQARARFRQEIIAGNAREFVIDKLAERDQRHLRMGDSRYMVEPNIKEGKGALRDLQTLLWLGKFAFGVESAPGLVEQGLFTRDEYQLYHRTLNYFWATRIQLHTIARRAEERLTFDVQPELARRMRYRARPGMAPVERFMRRYFLSTKQVGDLSALFIAHMEEHFTRSSWLPRLFRLPPRQINGFHLAKGRIEISSPDFFEQEPVRLVEMFTIADRERAEIHPATMRQASRDTSLINDTVRRDPRANAFFLEILTSRNDPERLLRLMNDAGALGRFLPDFGRVVAQMQYDMYHHYTVDEHTIRAIGLISAIEKGAADRSFATAIARKITSRRVLYVATLLHDIAKGRSGDHSELGEQVAKKLCPRLGMTAGETETVAWLVRHHLLMSATAFRRDLADYKSILDFAGTVQSVERLRLLYVLTVADISAVGPDTWNGWKAQLLRTLFESAEEVLRRGHKQTGRQERIAHRQQQLREASTLDEEAFALYARRLPDSYWISEPPEVLAANMALVLSADRSQSTSIIQTIPDEEQGATLVTIYAPDHPGLFYRVAGGISLGGANIVGARIYTTRHGMALDNLVIQDPLGGPFDEAERLARLEQSISDAISGKTKLRERLRARPLPRHRQEAFNVVPQAFIDNNASNRFTVIEVNALDRPALLYALTRALYYAQVTIHSAHIATYGERAVDTFYLTDLFGDKITDPARIAQVEACLLEAAHAPDKENAPANMAMA